MIEIEIMPAFRSDGGYLMARGHAEKGHELVCNAVTVIEDCLAANLANTWSLKVRRKVEKGRYELRWNKADRQGKSLHRANSAAGFAYTGLKALAAQYPEDVHVTWQQPFAERRD